MKSTCLVRKRSKNKLITNIEEIIEQALREDLGSIGDVTTISTVPANSVKQARIIAREEGILAGVEVARRVFHKVDERIKFEPQKKDGDKIAKGEVVALVSGPARGILTAERTALNFLTRMSGIATLTAKYVDKIRGTRAKILDTRKTTPSLRKLEKYAVRVGGGKNHRFGLFDMVLIKENHITTAGGIAQAISASRKYLERQELHLKIEVEVKNIDELHEALKIGVDRIMLDNMPLEDIKKAVAAVDAKVELEASGGITLENVRKIAATGVDFISVGELTHSAKALDMTLLI